jgi:hypothetical protein
MDTVSWHSIHFHLQILQILHNVDLGSAGARIIISFLNYKRTMFTAGLRGKKSPRWGTSDNRNMAPKMDDKPDMEAFENEERKDVSNRVAEEDISLSQRQMELRIM